MKAIKIFVPVTILLLSFGLSYYLIRTHWTNSVEEESSSTVSSDTDTSETEENLLAKTLQMTLSLDPEGYPVSGETSVVDIKLNSSVYEIPSIDVVVKYDPSYIEVSSIEDGQFGKYMVKEIHPEIGKIIISAINSPNSFLKGNSLVAKLNVKYLKTGKTKMTFDTDENASDVPLVGGGSGDVEFENYSVNIKDKSEINPEIDSEVSSSREIPVEEIEK